MRQQIKNYICAMTNGLYVRTHEEARAEGEIKAAAKELRDRFKAKAEAAAAKAAESGEEAGEAAPELKVWVWSIASGVAQLNLDDGKYSGFNVEVRDPLKMLAHFNKMDKGTVMVAHDFHLHLAGANPNASVVRAVKEAIAFGKNSNKVLIITGAQLFLPPELEKEMKVIEFSLPTREELRPVIEEVVSGAGINLNGSMEAALDAAGGLTAMETADAAALAVIEHTLSKSKDSGNIARIIGREKALAVKKNGILEVVEVEGRRGKVGGYQLHKEWQARRRNAYSAEARKYGLAFPKGELAVGPSGCGKSLGAYHIAELLEAPLLRLDFGKCFEGLVGGSEANVRDALATADAFGKCVLWIDEFEKGFAGSESSGKTDGGTTSRVVGTYLQWANDRKSQVYVYATANKVRQLPPELLRKGRFDEIWFVDYPNEEERMEIWEIQIAEQGRNPKDFELRQLARLSAGYSGAEIGALFNDAKWAAFADGKEPSDLLIAELSADLVPLSKMMAEETESLRKWAKGRARPASAQPEEAGKTRKLMN